MSINYFFKLRRIVKKIKYTFVNDQIKKAILKSVASKWSKYNKSTVVIIHIIKTDKVDFLNSFTLNGWLYLKGIKVRKDKAKITKRLVKGSVSNI